MRRLLTAIGRFLCRHGIHRPTYEWYDCYLDGRLERFCRSQCARCDQPLLCHPYGPDWTE